MRCASSWIAGSSPAMTAERSRSTSDASNLLQHRQQIGDELRWVLAHRKMAEPLHDGRVRAGATADIERCLAGAGIVVLAREQIKVGLAPIDLVDLVADVAVNLVEMKIAFEHAGPALQVVPQ